MSIKNQAILDALDNNLKLYPGVAQEPDWVMSILQSGTIYLTGSDDTGTTANTVAANQLKLANYCPIYDYQFAMTRGFNNESMSQDLTPTGLCAHELKVVAPFASIQVPVHAAFSQNTLIESVVLARLATVTSAIKADAGAPVFSISQYAFKNLYISGLVSKDDLICLSFRYTDIKYFKHSIDPKTGTGKGHATVSYHNLANSAGE